MFSHLSVDEQLKRDHQGLRQANHHVDAQQAGDAVGVCASAFEAVDHPDRDVGAPLKLSLAPARSFAQHLHSAPDGSGQLAVGLTEDPIRPPRALIALSRRHYSQENHCQTTEQEGQVFK